jgi:hypothetical protein
MLTVTIIHCHPREGEEPLFPCHPREGGDPLFRCHPGLDPGSYAIYHN